MRSLFLLLLFPISLFSQSSEISLSNYGWSFRKKGDTEWLPATIPGTVHTDLFKNKKIPDPFYGDNEKKLQWIEEEDWNYQTSFNVTQEELLNQHVELRFDGLDTYSKIYLNDSLILTSDNMFRQWTIDVKRFLKSGENNLALIFFSASKFGKKEAAKLSYTLPGDEKVFTRKAQYQYGWDWGPRYVTCGIYKDVKLILWNTAKIGNVECIQKKLTDSKAEVEFNCQISSDLDTNFILSVVRYSPELSETGIASVSHHTVHLKKGINYCSIVNSIDNPQRWWCNGLGKASLYPFSIQLYYQKKEIDSKSVKVGLRTLELVQDKDSIGKSFCFKLNGVPVFMKGANYIPPDNFLPRVTKSDYQTIVQNAVDANMNMLRVWGGGVYADDEFYNACDENGILVWQDFMFACAMYPSDEHFVLNVSEEIKQQVVRLRNHTSIALWCGNNEMDEGWKNWGWQKQYHYSKSDSISIWKDYTNLFQKTIPEIVKKYDSQRNYWQSSPSIGWGHKESLQQGDSHYWGVWWGMESFDVYKEKVGRFMSEYGFQGMPSLNCLMTSGVIQRPSDRINFNDSITRYYEIYDTTNLKAHQKHPTGYKTITTYMERDYKVPKRFENYVYVSQILQAEGMKTAIEAHRRAKPYCMGTLYWQLNDCWPVTSWSSVDYTGTWKALHYQAKRSYDNILISFIEEKDKYAVYIVNDNLLNEEGSLEVQLVDFNGSVKWNKSQKVFIKQNSSSSYFVIDKSELINLDIRSLQLLVRLKLNGVSEAKFETYCFVKPKDMELHKANIKITAIGNNKFELTTDKFAKMVYIDELGGRLSDNYFDLSPNQQKVITIINGEAIKGKCKQSFVGNLPLNLEIKSLFDTIDN